MKLNQTYNREEFIGFLKDDFLPDFSSDVREINLLKTKTIQSAKYLGECRDLELQIFELKTTGKSEKKISQALDSFKILREYQSYKALVAYFSEDDQNWRFAFLQMTPDLTDKGKITNKYSNPRRYSFLLGPEAKTKTPERYLIKDGQVKDFEDLQKRFSVEVVNKDFYREIARFFSRLVGGDTKLKSKTEHFQSELVLPSVDTNNHRAFQEYTVRLIGRIIFCWFLKQKKSAEGVSLLPEEFLSSKAVEDNTNYYHSVLEPIFFEILNKPREMRKPQFRNGYDRIPYLNGGLFDPHFDDFYEGQPNYALKIPDSWFKELFDILETYNFTIDENTALDVDLSIDPEMLGRIFENLLAEINPETGESARKSTGSYYTPRQIVEYMVDQSLIQYLITKTEIDEDKIKALVSSDTEDDELYPLDNVEKQKIVSALNEVKIIDPACGSGAFPIGILQKIVWMLGKVDVDGRLWFDKKLENLDPLLHEDFHSKFENENFDYIRKTGVIRDSIYGVDIQSIAVEVSKLRCFLTLIVGEDIDERKENRGIKPLPNLEFKFVAANSLINLPGSLSSNNGQTTMFEEDSEIEQLKKLRDLYFVSNGYEKEKIKNRFKDVQKEMFKKQIGRSGVGTMTMALADWDPFANKVSDWFDPEWMFGINKFSIVIGNPPYVSAKENSKNDKNRDIYRKKYPTLQGAFDLYLVFLLKGVDLLEDLGAYSWIIPNKLLISDYAEKSLAYLKDNGLSKVVNVSNVQVFDAGVYPIIIVGQLGKTYFDQFDVSSLDKLSSGVLDKVEDSFLYKTLSDFNFGALSGTTGFEATKIKPFIKEEKTEGLIPFVVSGCINPWEINFHNVRYMGRKYSKAYISKGSVSENKWAFWNSPKIIIAGMTKRIEATYFQEPLALGVGVYAIKDFKGYSPYYLVGLLNSKFLSFYLKTKFKDKHLAGGYLAINKSTIEKLPFIEPTVEIASQIAEYAESIQNGTIGNEIDKEIILNKIDILVYQLFDLSQEEIKIIEESVK